MSTLEDNLHMRRDKLTESSSRSLHARGVSRGKSSDISLAKMKKELEQKRCELKAGMQLAKVKKVDENLQAEILELKNNFN
jgi:hypothetical protein